MTPLNYNENISFNKILWKLVLSVYVCEFERPTCLIKCLIDIGFIVVRIKSKFFKCINYLRIPKLVMKEIIQVRYAKHERQRVFNSFTNYYDKTGHKKNF